ncbi:MAG TPA: PAS domain-containing sensor histidine kinase [Bacteroidales bacterium]|nr:PAS domain-containing sensor histidine kinase [Bacteroidales bacterium]
MKIKTKLNLGIGLLFSLIIILALFSIRQINLLSTASENILKDNKETIGYTKNMLKALSEIDRNQEEALNNFEIYLFKQKSNITEVGENELTEKLSKNFSLLQKNASDETAMTELQVVLFEIMNINLQAIEYKNIFAKETAHKSILLISTMSLICFIIALILLLKLPGNILTPIKELTSSIKLISANDYSQRVNFEGHNELGELAVSFNTMASKLEEYNKSNVAKLLTEKKITETLINNIHYPIIGFDTTNKINLVNDEFLKISGLSHVTLIGANILEIASENDLISQIIIVGSNNKAISSNKAPNTRIHLEIHGKDIYFEKEIQEISLANRDDTKGHLMGYVVILKNVTKYMELDLAKTNFIATVSHELKTPVSAIKLSLQLLENEKTGVLNQEQHELIKSCEEDTHNLLKIIAELTNLAQVETGNIQLNIAPVNLNDILKYAINTTKSVANQKNIVFEIDLPSDLPKVIADKEKTAWVLTNIISNAIRYSNENSKISISASNIENKMRLLIKDFGRGIESQYISRIFDRYFTVPGTKKEGSGLGLAISKEFIEAQGGEISVLSELGIGSTFSIVLNCKDYLT